MRNAHFLYLLSTVSLIGIEVSFSQTQNIPVIKTLQDSIFNAGDYIRCPIILFNLDKSTLDHLSNPKDSIKIIADFLRKNEKLVIELSNHTDYRANASYSYKPSFSRAKAIVDYLITDLHIDPNRVTPAGYGETKPKVLDQDLITPSGKIIPAGTMLSETWIDKNYPKEKNKEDYEFIMQQNRRTELKVIRTDFGK